MNQVCCRSGRKSENNYTKVAVRKDDDHTGVLTKPDDCGPVLKSKHRAFDLRKARKKI